MGTVPTTSGPRFTGTESRPGRFTQIAFGLGLAVAIVAAAWFVGGRAGFDQIGRGGVNVSLLPKIGQAAPDFAAYDVDGRPVRLSDFRGQPVWLNFWGSWCAPCRSEMPAIQAAWQQLQPQGLVLLAVSLDEPASDAKEYAALNHTTFRVLSDEYRLATGNAYPIANFPTHVFIDAEGIVRAIVLAEMSTATAVGHGQALLGQAAGTG